jgi:hypothetical protein
VRTKADCRLIGGLWAGQPPKLASPVDCHHAALAQAGGCPADVVLPRGEQVTAGSQVLLVVAPHQLGRVELASLPVKFAKGVVDPVGEVRLCRHVGSLGAGDGSKLQGWNDRAHPFTWTKTADEILPHATRERDSDAGH